MTWEFIQNHTHLEEGLNRLILQYRNASNIKNILTIFLNRFQILENENFKFKGIFNLDNASGIALDRIGDIVSQERLGFEDDIYRYLIYGRIAINISGGTPENIINIYKLISSATTVRYDEIYPASMQIQSTGPILDPTLISALVSVIDSTSPAGVSLSLLETYVEGNTFTTAEEDDSLDFLQGFSDEDNPGTGGILAEELYIGA